MCDSTTKKTNRRDKRRRRDMERGSTLLEAAISMAVLTIGVLGLLRMQVVASGSDAYAVRVDRATVIARDILSYLETIPFNSAILQVTNTNPNGGDLLDLSRAYNANFTGPMSVVDAEMYSHRDDGTTLPDALMATPTDPCAATGESCLFRGYVNPAILTGPPTTRTTLDFTGDGDADFQRYWIVSPLPDAQNPLSQGIRVVVIVRWYEATVRAHRRVVMSSIRHDPTALLP